MLHLLAPRFSKSVALALLATCTSLAVPFAASAAPAPRLIVGFEPGERPAAQALQAAAAGASTARSRGGARALAAASTTTVGALDAVVVPVAASDVDRLRRELLQRDDVRYVELDGVAHASDLGAQVEEGFAPGWKPNDTFISEQWALKTMHAEEAWEFSRGTGVTIAVVDSGVDYIHPDLAGRVKLGLDFVDRDRDPMDVNGHGTHVAGIAAGGADDGFGIAGIAPNAQILAVRVLNDKGAGSYSDVAQGIVYAASSGAKVINLSLGGGQQSELMRDALDFAASRGAIVTCATGNESANAVSFPGRYDSCFSVGATDQRDTRASFSNRGQGIDVVAPGVEILSSTMGGSHDSWDGTSMATPYVAGVAALLSAQGLGRRDVIAAIKAGATDLGPAGYDITFGAGRVDAAASVAIAARSPRGAVDTTAPVVTSVKVLAPKRTVRSTAKASWRASGRTGFKRYGTTPSSGKHAWSETKVVGARRVITRYRAAGGIVYRSTVTYKRVVTRARTVTVTIPVRVIATDDVGVDRVSVEIDGRTRGVDWSVADGWTVSVPCTKGVHKVAAIAFDSADNRASSQVRSTFRC